MGKNHRHKKQLKSEKAKVKLRVKSEKTKFLPKGTNVTNTAFKIKPIVVLDQLKPKDDTQLLSKRKLNIGELLSRLKHYNVNTRKDTCIELRQMIAEHAESVLQKNLSQILHSVSPLISDKESSVRKEANKLLEVILKHTNIDNVKPFFNILSSYIRCAMTNIDVAIQEDSLLFLDALAKYAPILLAQNSDKILPILISLLAKFQAGPKTLTIHMSQKWTSIKWIVKILIRLNTILETVIVNSQTDDKNDLSSSAKIYEAEEISRFPIFTNYSFTRKCPINFFQSPVLEQQEENCTDVSKYVETLIPLLYETWLEVIPQVTVEMMCQNGTIISQDCASVLNCITKIMRSLMEYAKLTEKNNAFNTKDVEKFLSCLLKQFPYFRIVENRKDIELDDDPKCVQENLSICHIFTNLNIELRNKHQIECAKSVVSFLKRCLVTSNYVSESEVKPLLSLLKIIFTCNFDNWKKKNVPVAQLLEDVIHFNNNKNKSLSRSNKDETFNLLCSVLSQPLLNSIVKYQVWLSTLPSLLCANQISENTIDTLLSIAKQNNGMFHQAFVKRIPDILDNVQRIVVTNATNQKLAVSKIVWMFYYVPLLYKENLECFARFLDDNQNSELFETVKSMLQLRFELKGTEQNIQMFQNYSWWTL